MTEAIRAWLTRIKAIRLDLEALLAADDYEDALLTEDQLNRNDGLVAGIQEAQTVAIQSQPGCLKRARYKPAPWKGAMPCIQMDSFLIRLAQLCNPSRIIDQR